MTNYIARLEVDGFGVTDLVLVDHPNQPYRKPVLQPVFFGPQTTLTIERTLVVEEWLSTGLQAEGRVTSEFWMQHFNAPFPADMDRNKYEIPVVWVRYTRR